MFEAEEQISYQGLTPSERLKLESLKGDLAPLLKTCARAVWQVSTTDIERTIELTVDLDEELSYVAYEISSQLFADLPKSVILSTVKSRLSRSLRLGSRSPKKQLSHRDVS